MPVPVELPRTGQKPLTSDETPRTITLGERLVPYILRRAHRRTIGLSIDHRGLRVGAPRRASLREVESLILQHSDWVAQKLDEWRNRRRPERLAIVDGRRLPMLGQSLEIRLAQGNNRALWNVAAVNTFAEPTLTLCLRAPEDAGRLLEKTLREKARALFSERLAHFAQRLALGVPPLALSSARTRWGSCSTKTGIRLNWRLIHFPHTIVDYVVAHEVAHLREMNHSPRFWAIVEQLYPNCKAARDELKRLAAQCPQW